MRVCSKEDYVIWLKFIGIIDMLKWSRPVIGCFINEVYFPLVKKTKIYVKKWFDEMGKWKNCWLADE